MTIVNTLKETLNGGYNGLHGEVVTEDCYRLQTIHWEPDIIFDLGANIGVFARYARSLFRRAKIISVEPHEENIIHFKKFTNDDNIILIEAAIGKGPVWHYLNSANGAMQCYLSEGLGYPAEGMPALAETKEAEKIKIETIMPAALMAAYWRPGQRAILKIDIEGAENSIFEDPQSMAFIKQMDYIAMEIHFYALTGKEHPEVVKKTMQALSELADTHICELNNKNFYAIKR